MRLRLTKYVATCVAALLLASCSRIGLSDERSSTGTVYAPPAHSPVVVAPSVPTPVSYELQSGHITPGDGHSYVWAGQRKHRSQAQIAALIRSDNRKVLRVRADTIGEQVAMRLGRGAFESRAAFADWLASGEVQMVRCTPQLLAQFYLSRVDGSNSVFDHTWTRTRCDPGEHFLMHNGRAFMSTTCMNVMSDRVRPVVQAAPPPPAPAPSVYAAPACPPGIRSMEINGYQRTEVQRVMPGALQGINAVESGSAITQKGASGESFSRSVGPKMGEAARNGNAAWSTLPQTVSLYWQPGSVSGMTPRQIQASRETIGTYTVQGRLTVDLPEGPIHQGKTLVAVFAAMPGMHIYSPPQSATMAGWEIWYFAREWPKRCFDRIHFVHDRR